MCIILDNRQRAQIHKNIVKVFEKLVLRLTVMIIVTRVDMCLLLPQNVPTITLSDDYDIATLHYTLHKGSKGEDENNVNLSHSYHN